MDTADDKHPPFSFGSECYPGLAKLIEECGEVLQVAGKLVMTGGVSPHYSGTDLVAKLREECTDLQAALDFFTDNDKRHFSSERYRNKVTKFIDWHNESPADARARLARGVADTP